MAKLCKEICQKCQKNYPGKDKLLWNDFAKKLWRRGRVWCRFGPAFGLLEQVKTDKIPERCPYKLEHVVMGK